MLLKVVSFSEQIVEYLSECIVCGDFVFGEKLLEVEFVKELDVSINLF